MANAKPVGHGVAALEAFSRGLAAIAIGFASLAMTVLAKIPDLLEKHANVATLYAHAVQRGYVGALGAGVMALVFWVWAYDAKIGTRETPSNRKWGMLTVGVAIGGFVALTWGGAGLLALSVRLIQVATTP